MSKKKSSTAVGFLFGAVMFFGAFPFLFWNEGRSLHRYQTLAEGRDVVVENVSTDNVAADNEAQLIHVTGFADAHEELTDQKFQVSVNDMLKLKRSVEMYQWDETHSGNEDSAASYSRTWSSGRIDSDRFDDSSKRNPSMPYQSATHYANQIQLGAFRLSRSLAESIDNWERMDASRFFAELPAAFRDKTTIHDQGFYQGADPNDPQIGDLRIHFEVAPPTDVSVIAEQTGDSFRAYAAKTVSGTIERLEVGKHSASEMFTHMETENKILTWMLRGGGMFMMFMGSMIILDPFMRLLNYVPLAGRLATSAIAMVVGLVTVALSVSTIAIAWFFYRPLWAIGLFGVAALLAFLASRLYKQPTALPVADAVVDDPRITVVD